jgi:gamma-glutamyl:cysteine ligase YbdK (ATP-grasp superfamily)
MRRHWIAVENKWMATRYGLAAKYIRTPGGKRRPLRHDLNELIHRVMPIARESGDDKYLAALQPVEKYEIGADRQRHRYRDSGNWKAVTDDMIRSLSEELESAQLPT